MRLSPAAAFMGCVIFALTTAACGSGDSGFSNDGSGASLPDAGGDGGIFEPPPLNLPVCVESADCAGGQVCREGLCREACAAGDPCVGELTVCDLTASICVECGPTGEGCLDGQSCVAQRCTAECRADSDCDPGETCALSSGTCSASPCTVSADCLGGFFCQDGACTPFVEPACERGDTQCSPNGRSVQVCNSTRTGFDSTACQAGTACTVRTGLARCEDNSSGPLPICSPGERGCVNTNTAFLCAEDGLQRIEQECGVGEACDSGRCRRVESPTECPVAAVRCREAGTDGSWNTVLNVNTLPTTVECSGFLSTATDATIEDYLWSLDPAFLSGANLTTTGETAQFVADVSGTYQVDLDVVDSNDVISCTTASTSVVATQAPREGEVSVSIQLTWETPGDANPDDTGFGAGSDMDVVLLNRNLGCWSSGPARCDWQSKTPDWGVVGPIDNPSHDIDDSDGAGPEVITMTSSASGDYYVGVEYYANNDYGPSTARVVIRVDGVVELDQRRELINNGEFWTVARITVPSGDVTFIDGFSTNKDTAVCD